MYCCGDVLVLCLVFAARLLCLDFALFWLLLRFGLLFGGFAGLVFIVEMGVVCGFACANCVVLGYVVLHGRLQIC